MSRPTRLEAGARSVLAYCVACPSWRELRSARAPSLRAAAQHLELVHDDKRAAAQLRDQARRIDGRHADT